MAATGRRILARCDAVLAGQAGSSSDPRPLLPVLRDLVELDHTSGLSSDAMRRTAAVLGGSTHTDGGAEVGHRRALLLRALATNPRPELDEFIERFGDLADDDLELKVPRFREVADHAFAPLVLDGVIASGPDEEGTTDSRDPFLAGPWRRAGLHLARLREAARSRIDRVDALLRRRALMFQERSWKVAPLPDAVFFLRLPEWTAALDGSPLPDPETLRARAETWRTDCEADASPTILVAPDGAVREDREEAPGDGVQGLAASPGTFTGPALILPADRPVLGEVAILPDADGRWLKVVLDAGAVVMRSGGVLSHLAMVLRDVGKPCVIASGVEVSDGDFVTVDGQSGRVVVRRSGGPGERP